VRAIPSASGLAQAAFAGAGAAAGTGAGAGAACGAAACAAGAGFGAAVCDHASPDTHSETALAKIKPAAKRI
jgi:hypothetical protein